MQIALQKKKVVGVALGEGFPECFGLFPECFRHSGKRVTPVVQVEALAS
jgi:hypothetical protein